MTILGVTFLIIFSPLSFSPVGEMQITPLLYCFCGYSVAVLFLRLFRYCFVSADYSATLAIASAASCRQTEKLGQSLKSMMAYEPSDLTMQSPPYTSIPVSCANREASPCRAAMSKGVWRDVPLRVSSPNFENPPSVG